MKKWICSSLFLLAFCFAGSQTASAATLCVNPHGNVGCFTTITAAVSHASASDLIIVAPGVYKEDVGDLGKPLSLVSQFPGTAVVDATGLSNGFYIDGFDNPGLSSVIVSGFSVKNAVNEGILITNASEVTVTGNILTGNDAGLIRAAPESRALRWTRLSTAAKEFIFPPSIIPRSRRTRWKAMPVGFW